MSGIRVTISKAAGSTPRDAGTQMMVWADRTEGTIGGGALEWQAMRTAREMLAKGQTFQQMTIPLGPGLGQCCGGSVTLLFEVADTLQHPAAAPLWIYGAGHVGRALVSVNGDSLELEPMVLSDWVKLSFKAPERAATVEPVPEADETIDYLCLVMPLRLLD